MLTVSCIPFGPFVENTYILHDETLECAIVDPGCYEPGEKEELVSFIEANKLKPVKILLTHSHIDHVLGNAFLADKYNIPMEMNVIDLPGLREVPVYGQKYGIYADPSPEPSVLLKEGDSTSFGNTSLQVLFTPGHSPGSICFFNREAASVISGDVLFYGSIGRTDLPGGDYQTLINSIQTRLLPLGDEIKVYSGHGPATTIGFEKKNNPFLNGTY